MANPAASGPPSIRPRRRPPREPLVPAAADRMAAGASLLRDLWWSAWKKASRSTICTTLPTTSLSSIIDAICFALYGSVPRYDDKRLVAPVVSQGKVGAIISSKPTERRLLLEERYRGVAEHREHGRLVLLRIRQPGRNLALSGNAEEICGSRHLYGLWRGART